MLRETDPAPCPVSAIGAAGERSGGVPGRDWEPNDWGEVALSRLRWRGRADAGCWGRWVVGAGLISGIRRVRVLVSNRPGSPYDDLHMMFSLPSGYTVPGAWTARGLCEDVEVGKRMKMYCRTS